MLAKLYVRIQTWFADDEGATATEYGLLVAFIAFMIIIGVTAFGTQLGAFFTRLSTTVSGWSPGA
jgi:pilus assembly protein Flp/PilA